MNDNAYTGPRGCPECGAENGHYAMCSHSTLNKIWNGGGDAECQNRGKCQTTVAHIAAPNVQPAGAATIEATEDMTDTDEPPAHLIRATYELDIWFKKRGSDYWEAGAAMSRRQSNRDTERLDWLDAHKREFGLPPWQSIRRSLDQEMNQEKKKNFKPLGTNKGEKP